MLHEIENESVNITKSDIDFEKVYKQEFVPKKYIKDIKAANVLLIPEFDVRGQGKPLFPEGTTDLYRYLKAQSEIRTEICIDDSDYQQLELHSAIINIATIIVKDFVLPIVVSLISSYLYDKLKAYNKKDDEQGANVHIIVEMEDEKSLKIDYQGNIKNFEPTMKTVENDILKKSNK